MAVGRASSLLDFGSGGSVILADPSKRLSRLGIVLEHLRAYALLCLTRTADPWARLTADRRRQGPGLGSSTSGDRVESSSLLMDSPSAFDAVRACRATAAGRSSRWPPGESGL